ncbi:hypothetical protein TrispH2_007361 [Trichoplax sp. H2]|nr:hypothetical protein TrispH2_007361 [Trichoplax sp. H2]|eukprot:RDD41477.1 hypothetical protein TrispH2_007361 [Trichoplax sp. H2]
MKKREGINRHPVEISPVVISLSNKVQPQRPHTSITLRSHLFMKNFAPSTKKVLHNHEKSELVQKLNRNLSDNDDAIKKFETIWTPRPNSRIKSPRRLGKLSQDRNNTNNQSDAVIPEKLPLHHSHSISLNSLIIKIPRPKTSPSLSSTNSCLPTVQTSPSNLKNQAPRQRPQTVDGVSATRMKSIRAQRLKFLYDEPLRRHSVKAVKEVEDNILLEHTIKPPIVPGEPLPPKHGMDHHRPWITYLHSSDYNKSADVNQVLYDELSSRDSTPLLGHYVDKFYKVEEGQQILLGYLDQGDGYHICVNGHQSKLHQSKENMLNGNNAKNKQAWQPLSLEELVSHSPPSHIKEAKIEEKCKQQVEQEKQDEILPDDNLHNETKINRTTSPSNRLSSSSIKTAKLSNENITRQHHLHNASRENGGNKSPSVTPKEIESKIFSINYSSRPKRHSASQRLDNHTLEINNSIATVKDNSIVVSSIMKSPRNRNRPRSNYSVQFRLPTNGETSSN